MSALLLLSLSLSSFPVPGPRVATHDGVAGPGLGFGVASRSSGFAPAPDELPAEGAPGDAEGDATGSDDEAPEDGTVPDDVTAPDGSGEGNAESEGEGEPVEASAGDGEPEEDARGEGDGEPEENAQGEGDGELGLDDIFGTSEDHTDVTVVSEGSDGSDGSEGSEGGSTPAATARRPRMGLSDKLDTRIRIVTSAYFDTARTEERLFSRNENRLEFYFAYTPNEHLQIVGDVEPVFFGVAQAQELDDLATRQMLTPFHIESDAAYIALNDILPGLDIKIGRQTLVWGTADKFNPTNNINPDDLEDRPLFTEPIGNQMVVLDYAPLGDKLWFQGVYVPIFYPALLPPSAARALKDPQAPVPYANEEDLLRIGALQELLTINETLVPEVTTTVKVPKARFSNGQSAVKLGTTLGGVDMSVSYFNGRHDIPTPILAEAGIKMPMEEGGGPECCYTSHVTLIYPRMQVIGADFATSLAFLGDMGLWGEGGLFFPQAQDFLIEFPIPVDITPSGRPNDDGMANPVRSMQGPTILERPFVKATAGLDYSFGKHVYVQGQYLRGFIDEFGAGHLGNYIVGGTDLIFFDRHLIFRMFGVADLPTGPDDNSSFVLYPELILVPPWGSVTMELGSFFLLGESDTKFGQAATGSSIAFFKVAGQF